MRIIPAYQLKTDVFNQRYRGSRVAYIGKVAKVNKLGIIILKEGGFGSAEVWAQTRRENAQAVDTLKKDDEIIITGTISEMFAPSFFIGAKLVLENVTIVDRRAKPLR